MFIVDLAGSERISRSGVTGQGFEEATTINQSLTALGRVVITLIEGGKGFVLYNASPLTMVLKGGLGGNSKTALVACVTQANDSMSESLNTLRFAMQASHVKNKVAKNASKAAAEAAADKISSAGNSLLLEAFASDTIELPTGPLEVYGSWDSSQSCDKPVVLLGGKLGPQGIGGENKWPPEEMRELCDALAAEGCQVVIPSLPGTSNKDLEGDAQVLLALLDWLGVAQPVVYGRDYGAIRAMKFKISSPKRCAMLVMEDREGKIVGEKEFKAHTKKSSADVWSTFQKFMWIWDGAFPSSKTPPLGNNLKGYKGSAKSVVFLWPFGNKGRHDPGGKYNKWSKSFADMIVATLKIKAVQDSFLLTEADVARKIASGFKSGK